MRLFITACALCLAAAPAAAQPSGRDRADTRPQRATPQQPAPPPVRTPAGDRPLTLFTSAASVFDTNINHDDEDALESLGMVLAAGARFRDDPRDPIVDVTYTMGFHRYLRTDQWDRLSHHVRAVVEAELSGPWTFATVGEVSLKGTSEDRELSDQYLINPRLDYRFGERHRVRLYGALRAKRYDEDLLRNATNRYAGAEVQFRSTDGKRVEVGGRLEGNDAVGPRNDYSRYTYYTEFLAPVSPRDQIELELTVRTQQYLTRRVENSSRLLRRDRRWIPSFAWVRALTPDADLEVGYRLESRTSNDPDKTFHAHLFSVSVLRRW